MSPPSDSSTLQSLTEDYRRCMRADDHVGALDALEEIVRRGWAQAPHLTALGHCLMRNRQRQDAKRVWLEAFGKDASFDPCQQALDQFFPGWRKRAEKAAAPSPPPPPPELADDSEEGGLHVEIHVPAERTAPAPAPVAPRASAPPPVAKPAPAASPPQVAPTVSPPSAAASSIVNWDYVLADAQEMAGARR